MTVQLQRFCPLCDRTFIEGEAVLRCEGCGVLHHPACWVRNDGCVTEGEHKRVAIAQAYSSQRTAAPEAPHPGEGTRRIARPGEVLPPAGDPVEGESVRPVTASAPPAFASRPASRTDEPVIGAAPVRHRPAVEPEEFHPPTPPRRYAPHLEGGQPRRPLPKVYGRHRWLTYWYFPVAALIAVAIAGGVIWVAEQLSGGDGNATKAEATAGAGATAATAAPATALPSGFTTPAPGATGVAPAGGSAPAGTGKFRADQVLVVTGAGDCLNVRTKAGRDNYAIVCLPDGAEVTVKGGPEDSGGLRWWKVATPLGEGWAAEDYLVAKP
ncbi:MAG: hypothetical protein HYX53_08115 [Chloroflexi bacterium]|nr:hypothetical protein [Chloroflexota bacterium]